jgi:hypothetical protein
MRLYALTTRTGSAGFDYIPAAKAMKASVPVAKMAMAATNPITV